MEKNIIKDKTSRVTSTRELVQLFVILFGALWGCCTFYFKDIYLPAHKPTSLDLLAILEKVGKNKGTILIRARITAQNKTDREIYIPAYWFTVRGYQLYNSSEPVNLNHKDILGKIEGDELISTYAPIKYSEVIAQKRIVYSNAWWDPGDKTHNEVIFAIPDGKFDFLELSVYYLFTRDDSVLEAPIWGASEDGSWSAQFTLKKGGNEKSKLNKWMISTRAGLNWYVTTLPLRNIE